MSVILLVSLPILLSLAIAGLSAAPFVPTRKRDVARFMELARPRPGERVYDLGCGDGRIVAAAAEAGAQAVGYEIAILPLALAWIRCWLSPARRRCRVVARNFWTADCSDADVIFFFLLPDHLNRLAERLKGVGLRPGTRVVSYVWPIPGWTAAEVSRCPNRASLYLYVMPSPPPAAA